MLSSSASNAAGVSTLHLIGALIFALALIHTFATKAFEVLARRYPRHQGLLHMLGEVEIVFGFWAFVLIAAMAVLEGSDSAIGYVETRQYTEPLFVFVIMVVAASRPVLELVQRSLGALARLAPLPTDMALTWLGLAVLPLTGSLITEPAAMTLAALTLAPVMARPGMPEWGKYAALGALFVNVSIGGTLTAYAAPPVLMVARTWHWDSLFMASHIGWKAALAVAINASGVALLLRRHLTSARVAVASEAQAAIPLTVSLIHVAFLAAVVMLAHHQVLFLGLFMLFLGFTQAYPAYQSPLILKEGLLVGFFLAGLVVLGGMQQWWLQACVASLSPLALFFGATALTAITDNAALTYLGSLIGGLSDAAKYMLMTGAVAGGGLTVIANAPNPAGAALLRRCFADESISAIGLLLGAAGPTCVACCAFLLL